MNTLIAFACLLAVAHGSAIGLGHLGGYGWGSHYVAPIVAPAAISTANVVKAAPIPVIKTIAAPIITAPVIRTVAAPISLGWGGYGLGGWGGYGYGHGGYGYGHGYGHGGYGGWSLGGWGKGWH